MQLVQLTQLFGAKCTLQKEMVTVKPLKKATIYLCHWLKYVLNTFCHNIALAVCEMIQFLRVYYTNEMVLSEQYFSLKTLSCLCDHRTLNTSYIYVFQTINDMDIYRSTHNHQKIEVKYVSI